MSHFTIAELIYSSTAEKKNIDNEPNFVQKQNLQKLIDVILDPIREKYGKQIISTSGFRCPKLNKLIGGVQTSDHLKGKADDIVGTPNTLAENKKLYKLIKSMDLPIKQCILESGGKWIHIAYDENDIRRQYFNL